MMYKFKVDILKNDIVQYHNHKRYWYLYVVLFFLVGFLISIIPAISQNYEFRFSKIVDEKGMDPGATFAITQDKTGFLWFGTIDGLYRYDGFNYKIYRNEKGNQNSLAWNTIRALDIGNDNKLWIGTQGGGLDCFDLNTNTFTHYPSRVASNEGPSGSDIWALEIDKNGNVWIGVVGQGIDMLDTKTKKFRHFKFFKSELIENVTVRSIFEDSQGLIWIGTLNHGAFVFNPKTGKITNYQNNPNDINSIGSNSIYQIFEDSHHRLLLCSYSGGLSSFERKTGAFKSFRISGDEPSSVLVTAAIENREDEFWVGTEHGVYVSNFSHSKIVFYKHLKNNPNSLTDDRIRTIFKDRSGIIWVASEAGVDKIIEQRNFKIYKNKPGDSNSLPEGIVRAIHGDREGNIWFGIINKGLIRFNPDTKKFKQFVHNPSDPGSISGVHVTSIFQDSNGHLWVGEWNTGLNKFNTKTGKFSLVAGIKNTTAKLCDTRIQSILEAEPGLLWIGTEGGINLYNDSTQSCTYLLHQKGNPNSLSGNSVQSNAFIKDSEGNLWVGTWSEGLNKIEFLDKSRTKLRFSHWKYDASRLDGINNNNIISLLLKDSILWIGTFGGGLNKLNLVTGKFKYFDTENGLSNNVIFSILEDSSSNLWLSTDRGLSKFNPELETFVNYFKSDGLQDDHFFWGSSFKSNTGELFFGGINGVNSFNPAEIIKNSTPPKPVITDIKIFEKSILSQVVNTEILKLSHNQNYITIEYASLDFIDPTKNQYAIKMEGMDDEWHFIGNRRITSYSNLPKGDYIFRVKAANSEGVWSKDEASVRFIIQPPWYNAWTARFFYFVIVVGGLLSFYFIRIGILKKQTRKLEELVGIRTSKILDQQKELKKINSDLTLQKEELSNTILELKKAQNQLIESEKMASLGILTAGIAHEINNPLNFIQAGIYGLEGFFEENNPCPVQCDNHPDIRFVLDSMRTGISRVAEIVQSLNYFSRQVDTTTHDCNIPFIIDNCLLVLNNRIKHKIEIVKSYNSEHYIVKGNEGKLHQVFFNIIANAVQSIDNKGFIEIVIIETEDKIQISIKDNGCGIKEEHLSRIFDPFFTTKEVGIGTGLGLSTTYGIIKEHHGKIEFKSKVGVGTEAIILLPYSR